MQIRLADSISILTSGICLIHCLATPLLLVVGYGSFIEQEGSKYIFVIISFLSIFYAVKDSSSLKIGGVSFTRGYSTVHWQVHPTHHNTDRSPREVLREEGCVLESGHESDHPQEYTVS